MPCLVAGCLLKPLTDIHSNPGIPTLYHYEDTRRQLNQDRPVKTVVTEIILTIITMVDIEYKVLDT